MDLFFAIILHSKHQVEVDEVWVASVELQVVNEVIQYAYVKTLDVLYDQKYWPLMTVHIIFFKNLLDAVKSFIFNDV
jgi:hypothetical protein